ncbi:hypothetical protein MY092_005611 [Salmonella enterica]|nr:hypothetical protein [Salmonella enterica]
MSLFVKRFVFLFLIILLSGCFSNHEKRDDVKVKFGYGGVSHDYDLSKINYKMELETAIDNCRIRDFSTAIFYETYNNTCTSHLNKEEICPSVVRVYKCIE